MIKNFFESIKFNDIVLLICIILLFKYSSNKNKEKFSVSDANRISNLDSKINGLTNLNILAKYIDNNGLFTDNFKFNNKVIDKDFAYNLIDNHYSKDGANNNILNNNFDYYTKGEFDSMINERGYIPKNNYTFKGKMFEVPNNIYYKTKNF